MRKLLLFLIACATGTSSINAQDAEEKVNELKLNLDEAGTKYVKWTFSNQVWIRYDEHNPGSTVMGVPEKSGFDIGLRRSRIQFYGQLTDHVFFYTQFGQNNFNFLSQNAGNRKLQVFFHDALGEYNVFRNNDWLKLGAGLTITNGLSRFSQPGISTILTMDVPVFAQATVDQTDQFSRKLSVYARGLCGRFDYRIVVSDPFPVTTNGSLASPPGAAAGFSAIGHHKQYQGLFIFNFLEKEPHTTPYMSGTYLGRKTVLNLEAGMIRQKSAMWTRESSGDTTFHSMNLWCVAMFYDSPLDRSKGTAISAYTGFFNLDYGPRYLRYNGPMNPANGISNGAYPGSHGNSFPMFGTGTVLYGQIGYLMRKNLLPVGSLLPYLSVIHADYGAISSAFHVFNLGINWLILSHHAKITLDYQSRPYFQMKDDALKQVGRKGQIVLQYQILL